METLGKAKRVRIYVSEDDRADGKPLHLAILELLRRENAQGATVLKGVEGFGATGQIHVSNLADVEWVDRPEQVERLAPRIRSLVRHGLITVDDTEVLLFEPHFREPLFRVSAAATRPYILMNSRGPPATQPPGVRLSLRFVR